MKLRVRGDSIRLRLTQAEVAAIAASEGFASLRAPVVRVTPPFAPPPLPSSLQLAYYPQPDDVVAATATLLDRASR